MTAVRATSRRPDRPGPTDPVPAPSSCDAIVIGAGHNGLVAANYLADAGLKVLVLERRPEIGGMTRSGYPIPQAPDHLINHCAVDPIFWPASRPAQDFGLPIEWVNVDPAFAYLHPGGESVAFWRDPRRTAGDMRRFSRSDAAAFLEWAELSRAAADVILPMFAANPARPNLRALAEAGRGAFRHRRRLTDVGAFLLASGREVIEERFDHPVIRSAMHMASASLYPSSFPGSTIQMLILEFVHRFGCARPVGGTQRIPDALTARLTARGGAVLTEARVQQISVSGGRATGVVLTDGREIRASNAVVAACDARQALTELLPVGTLPQHLERRAQAIPVNGLGWGQLKIDIACSGRLDLARFEGERADGADLHAATHWIGTEDGTERAYRCAAAGLLPEPGDIAFYNTIPTGADPSQAPDRQDTLYLIAVTSPAEPQNGWTDELKRQAVDDAIGKAGQFYGGLAQLQLGRTAFTNAEMADELGAASQAHVDWVLNRLGPLRPARGLSGFSTPVAGLYLAGAGCHPGAAVTGTPGYLGAHEALRVIKQARKRAHVHN
jgi:phytoene dehydrogenase-like protein